MSQNPPSVVADAWQGFVSFWKTYTPGWVLGFLGFEQLSKSFRNIKKRNNQFKTSTNAKNIQQFHKTIKVSKPIGLFSLKTHTRAMLWGCQNFESFEKRVFDFV